MRISWLKFEPRVSNFPTVIEILPSISITQAKKVTFWYALFLTFLTFCRKMTGIMIAFLSLRYLYPSLRKKYFIFNFVKEHNVRKLNNINKEIKNNFL